MTKKTRLIILLVCVSMFFAITPFIIGYSLGYRIDFEKKRFVAMGGIYLRVWPSPADIYIDSAFVDKTSGLSNSIFTQNLMPKNHLITVKKDGYFDYNKTLLVNENQVTKLEHITLFKKDIAFFETKQKLPLGQKTEEISPDKQKLLSHNNYEIFYSFINSQNKDKIFLNRFSEKIGEAFWLNNDYIIFTLNGKIKISEIDTNNEINMAELPQTADKIYFSQEGKKLYIQTGKEVLVSEVFAQ